MRKWAARIAEGWRDFRDSGRLHNMVVFLIFLGISAVFWFILALNDSVQRNVTVRINVVGVPDSVKFITTIPEEMHVMVRDKGTSLMRAGGFRHPSLTINFKDFAKDDVLRYSRTDLMAGLKATFGGSATILSTSLDSIRASFASGKGKRVPVVCVADFTPSAGFVVSGAPRSNPPRVMAYGPRNILDTLNRVFTRKVLKRSISDVTEVTVSLVPVAGVRLEPTEIKMTLPVEPLVAKDVSVQVTAQGVPHGVDLLLFPSTVMVSVYVPMSEFSQETAPVEAWVEYRDVALPSDKVPVYVRTSSEGVFQAKLSTDSVEYAIVR